jgi:serine/threonine protein phosphatase PrpC
MNQCRSCSKENQVGAKFCRHCGNTMPIVSIVGTHPINNGNGDVPLEEKFTLPLIVRPGVEETIILKTDSSTPIENPDVFPKNPEKGTPIETIILSTPDDGESKEVADDSLDPSTGYGTLILEPETEEQLPDLEEEIAKPGDDEKKPGGHPTGYETLLVEPLIEDQDQFSNGYHNKISDDAVTSIPETTDKMNGDPISDNSTIVIHSPNPKPAGISLAEQVSETGVEVSHPLPSGHVVQERYRILSILAADDIYNLYEVEDLAMCWNCGHVHDSLEDIFCENCGAAMEKKPTVQLREISIQDISGEEEGPPFGAFIEGGYHYVIETKLEDKRDQPAPVFHMAVGFQSDVGNLRDVDEDSVLVMQLNAVSEMHGAPSINIFAIADGIGGTNAGEVASKIAVHTLATKCIDHILSPELAGKALSQEDIKSQLIDAVSSANLDILAAREECGTDMGCTFTMVFVRDNQAVFVNVGDSRIYLIRRGELTQITEDHSIVAKLLSQNQIQPEEVYAHEQKSVIYRSLGEKPDLEVEDSIVEVTLEPGDRMVLCCDGLWEMVPDSFMEDVLLEYFDPQAVCDRLVEMANQAGGDDNISVIVVNVQTLKRFR